MTTSQGPPAQQALLDALLQRAPLAVYCYDRQGTCTFASGAVYDELGVDVDRMVGANVFEQHADDPGHVARLRQPLAGQTVRSQHSDGAYGGAVVSSWLAPLHDADGAVHGAIGVSIDVTDQVLAEQARALFQGFVAAAPQFIAIAGLDGQVRYVNPAGRALAGLPDAVAVGRTTISDYLTPEGLKLSEAVEQPEVLANGAYSGETTLRHWPTDTGIPVHVESFLIGSPGTGEPIALATVQTDIREVIAARESLEDNVARQRGLIVHMHEVAETERRRLAADVHDDTLQVLAGANLRLQGLRKRAADLGMDELAALAESLDSEVREASNRLRRVLFELEPSRHAAPQQLAERLTDYASATFGSQGTDVRIDVAADADLPAMVAQVLFRIAQQALTNVARHAAADHVDVEVTSEGAACTLRVTDDGRGLPREPVTRFRGGLRSMVERAEAAGGSCVIEPGPGARGTRVTAILPRRIGDIDESANRSSRWAFLEQTMESISDGFAAIDNDWRYVYVNRLGEEALGRGPGELIGQVIWDAFDVPDATAAAYRRAREQMRPVSFVGHYPRWGRWFENRVFPSDSGLSVFFRDITAQKEQEFAAAEHARRAATGREVLAALRDEPDLRAALGRAAEAVRSGWGIGGVQVRTTGAAGRQVFEVSAGEREADDRLDLPLKHSGIHLATVTLTGRRESPHDDDLLSLFALRIAAG